MTGHSQDWIIVIEALAQWAGPPSDLAAPRRARTYELIEAIAAAQLLPPAEMVRQAIQCLTGPRGNRYRYP